MRHHRIEPWGMLLAIVFWSGSSRADAPREPARVLPGFVRQAEVTGVSGHPGTYVWPRPGKRWLGFGGRVIVFEGDTTDGGLEIPGGMVLHGPLELVHVLPDDSGRIVAWRFVSQGDGPYGTRMEIRRRSGTRATVWFHDLDRGFTNAVVSMECSFDFERVPTRIGTVLEGTEHASPPATPPPTPGVN